jgi:hypothetical protein
VSISVLILFSILGVTICARARVAGGAVVFGVLAVVLFVATPMGAGMPGAVSSFLSLFDQAATPVLNDRGGAG